MKELKPQVKSALFWLGGLILAGALFGSGYKLAEKNFSSKLIEGPTPTPALTLVPTPTEGIKEEPKPIISSQVPKEPPLTPTTVLSPRPTLSVLPTSSFGKVELLFTPKYTSEPISSFLVEVKRYSGESVFSFEGAGNSYVLEKIEPGEYRVEVYVANREKLCSLTRLETAATKENDPYFFKVKGGDQLKKTIQIYPYMGMINLLTVDRYPIPGIEVIVTNYSGSENYYSTRTDSLGRAIVYTVNPLPQYIKFKLPTGDFIKEFNMGSCLWWETVAVPLALDAGKISVNLENKTYHSKEAMVYLTKIAPYLERKFSSITGAGGDTGAFGRGVFETVWFVGDKNFVEIKAIPISLNAGESKEVVFESVRLGEYYILARTSDYMVSNLEPVQLSKADEAKSVNLVIQYEE